MIQARSAIPTLLPLDASKYRGAADLEKAQTKHEERELEWRDRFDAKVREIMEARRAQLVGLPQGQLVEMAIRPRVAMAIQYESSRLLHDYLMRDCIRCGDDHEKPYFETIAEVPVQQTIREMLLTAIAAVEQVGSVEIKNSQGKSVYSIGLAASTPEATTDLSTGGSRASGSRKRTPRGGSSPSSIE